LEVIGSTPNCFISLEKCYEQIDFCYDQGWQKWLLHKPDALAYTKAKVIERSVAQIIKQAFSLCSWVSYVGFFNCLFLMVSCHLFRFVNDLTKYSGSNTKHSHWL